MSNTFSVGDRVLVAGSPIEGEVIEIGWSGWRAGKVCVRRPNPAAAGINMTHWVKVDRIQRPTSESEKAEETPC
jgi:hypothetical protein